MRRAVGGASLFFVVPCVVKPVFRIFSPCGKPIQTIIDKYYQ